MNKANHQANIVRITDKLPHTNADTLELIRVGDYQVVSKKGQFNLGDLAVYIQPDSVVPQTEPFKFIWGPYSDVPQTVVQHTKDPETGKIVGCVAALETLPYEVPEKKRRITVRKFRGEWSEGLLLPISDFSQQLIINQYGAVSQYYPFEGEDVSDLLGITHYDPDAGKEVGESSGAPKVSQKRPKSFRGWVKFFTRRIKNLLGFGGKLDGATDNVSLGIPTYDVDAYKNYKNTFVDGEQVQVTEKIHGSNARYVYLDGTMYAGSRKLWKSANSSCIFRRALREIPWIEEWCRAHEGYVLWGEVTPTQGKYEYGRKDVQFFVFDVYTPDGKWLDESTSEGLEILTHLQSHTVPVLYKGPFDVDVITKLVDGPSTVSGAKHIREGVVVKTVPERHVHGLGRAQLKLVSNAFLEKDNK